MKKYTIFFDFDNTITRRDIFDDMLLRFSVDNRWEDLEKRWKEGRIGSRECLQGQLESIRITKKRLDGYLANIKVDPYFKKLIRLFNSRRIKTFILSDNFDYILSRILKANKIWNLKTYSNRIGFDKTRLVPDFPFVNKDCLTCGHCKTNSLLSNVPKGASAVYIGDGLSDVCPSRYANIVFAKESLLEHMGKKRLPHIAYRSLRDVYKYFKECI